MYANLAPLAAFVLAYSSVAGAIERTWLSGPIIFTGFGLLIGPVGFDLHTMEIDREVIRTLAELTLALALFTDAAGADMRVLKKTGGLPAPAAVDRVAADHCAGLRGCHAAGRQRVPIRNGRIGNDAGAHRCGPWQSGGEQRSGTRRSPARA